MIHSFSPKAYKKPIALDTMPETIILRIHDLVLTLKEQINQIYVKYATLENWYMVDESTLLTYALSSIDVEQDAEFSLAYDAYEMLQGSYYTPYENVMTDIANLFVSFGKAIIARIKYFGLYEDGYLPYRFKQWMERDALLVLNDRAAYHLYAA